MRLKRVISATLACAMALSMAACGGTGTSSTPASTAGTGAASSEGTASSGDTVKIGVMTDHSSTAAATTAWYDAGAEMAVKECNDAGGINGKMVEIVYRDTATDSAQVAQKATELVGEGVVAILGPKSDGEAPTGAQWAETNKFPMVTSCTMNTRVTIENASRYMFSSGFNAWAIANMNAKYAEDQGWKSAYFIGNDGGASGDTRDFFFKALEGSENMGSSQVSANSTEFSNIISSVVGKDPDVIVGGVSGPNFVSLINQGQQFGLWDMCDYLGWYTCDSTNTSALAEAGNFPYGKVHGVDLWPFWLDTEENNKLVEMYKAMGDGQDLLPSDMGYTSYIGMRAIIEALKSTDDWSPEGVTDALTNVKFTNPFGEEISFRDFDHVMNHTYYYVTAVEDTTGKWDIPVGEIYAEYSAEEVLPTKEDLQQYAQENGYEFKDLSQLG